MVLVFHSVLFTFFLLALFLPSQDGGTDELFLFRIVTVITVICLEIGFLVGRLL